MSATVSLQTFCGKCQSALHMSDGLFKKVWATALATHKIAPTPQLDTQTQGKINAALTQTVSFHGDGLKVDFPPVTQKTHAMAKYLLGQKIPFSQVGLGLSDLYSLFVERDREELRNLRAEFRSCLANLPMPTNAKEEFNTRIFISNILTLLPFTYPDVGSPLAIPTKTATGWKLVDYHVAEVIQLTPSLLSSPIPAYLLKSAEGPPLLIFMGTTYPTGKGAAAAVCADFTPGMSVGHVPMLWGMSKIRKAISGLQNIEVMGVSLGGACGEHLLRMLTPRERAQFSRFDLFRPPGLHAWNWSQEYNDGPEVNIYIHPGDIVSAIGFYPTGSQVNLFEIIDEDGVVKSGIKSHACANNGEGLTTYLRLDPKVVNSDNGRKVLTFLHALFGPIIYFITTAISLIAQLFYFLVLLLDKMLPL